MSTAIKKAIDLLARIELADGGTYGDLPEVLLALRASLVEPVATEEERLLEIAKSLPPPEILGWNDGGMCEPDSAIKGYTKRQVLAILAQHWAAPQPKAEPARIVGYVLKGTPSNFVRWSASTPPPEGTVLWDAPQQAPAVTAREPEEALVWECKPGGLKPLSQRLYDAQPEAIKRHYTRIVPPYPAG